MAGELALVEMAMMVLVVVAATVGILIWSIFIIFAWIDPYLF
jgi:hypothetical protein